MLQSDTTEHGVDIVMVWTLSLLLFGLTLVSSQSRMTLLAVYALTTTVLMATWIIVNSLMTWTAS